MNLLISAGEASGDAYGAQLLSRLQRLVPGMAPYALGGARLSEAGAHLLDSSARWGAMGVIESVKVAPRVALGGLKAIRHMKKGPPGLFLPIDFGFLNIRLAKAAKEAGWKVLYFIPPGSWRRDRQGSTLPSVTDEIVTPFTWSAEMLQKMGAKAHCFGHPLLDMVASAPEASTRKGLALLPGSRVHEIKANLGAICQAVKGLESRPSITFGAASTLKPQQLLDQWEKLGGPPAEATHEVHALLKRSAAGIICSGTATLEAALCGCPSVVVYRLTPVMKLETTLYKPKFDFAALPNILLGREAFPELLAEAATPEAIRRLVSEILIPSPARRSQLEAIQEVKALAGNEGCLDHSALRASLLLKSFS